ncbi:hypothetical protein BBD42_27065 [Paenibacillus sp. BIHB 4019]|uniref:Uncharacterized protein n=1 Tax=Paenibacillus sp. BIHB 4019 TaxID=1870819 RepID=A0A1B2DPV7_9BACL|nr:hypothetical protein [Paenibacillus sp. BIHB 4019]ANY69745.1 hypothetical protein BBD42_27065 [Paenibacillus sp. BIHB 4019]
MKMKKINLERRKEYIELLRTEIEEQEKIIKLIETYKPMSFEQEVLLNYAILGTVQSVANKLNADGHRLGERKYIHTDISAIIMQKPANEFHSMVKKAFEHNKKGISYRI